MKAKTYCVLILTMLTCISFSQTLPRPLFSSSAGFYPDSVIVSITSGISGASIHYTTDGSTPTQSSPLYSSPIVIVNNSAQPDNISLIPTNPSLNYPVPGFDTSRADSRGWLPPYLTGEKITVLKARCYKNGFISSPDSIAVASFIIRPALSSHYTIPVISLCIDSTDLFSQSVGIYIYGADSINEGNYNSNQKKKFHFEFFEANGQLKIAQFCKGRIHGNGGRHAPQKSLQLLAEKNFGDKYFNHRFFVNDSTEKFSKLLLRNGGHRPDCMPRDDIAGEFLQSLDNIVQRTRHCVVFLNGEYWGVQTLKDVLDDNYLSDHFNWQNSFCTILSQTGSLDEGQPGEELPYTELLNFVQNADMTQNENLKHVWEVLDVKTFTDFQCANIFLGNGDWPGNNTRFWRFKHGPHYPGADDVADGKWRWMLYDFDAAFGGDCEAPSVNVNLLDDALNSAFGSYTRVLRKCILNDSFKVFFINRFADLLNSDLLSSRLSASHATVKNKLDPEMNRYVNRWRYPSDSLTLLSRINEIPSLNKWNSINSYLSSFIQQRHAKTRKQFINYFGLTDTVRVTLNVNDTTMGKLQINSIYLDKDLTRNNTSVYPWSGVYFNGNPVTVTAHPYPGFRIRDWGLLPDSTVTRNMNITSDTAITVYFEADPNYSAYHSLYINEILASNQENIYDEYVQHDDWIEIYNGGLKDVDLKGFYISDDPLNKTKFRIDSRSEESIIPSKGFKLLWADKDTLQGKLHLNFKLSAAAGFVYLYAPDGASLVDSINYSGQTTDISFGRSHDGSDSLITFKYPTPNQANKIIEDPDKETFYLWPNPVQQNGTLILSQRQDIEVFDVCGKLISSQPQVKYLNLTGLSKGIYFIRPLSGYTQKFVVH